MLSIQVEGEIGFMMWENHYLKWVIIQTNRAIADLFSLLDIGVNASNLVGPRDIQMMSDKEDHQVRFLSIRKQLYIETDQTIKYETTENLILPKEIRGSGSIKIIIK
ncbi:delta [New Kent County virus]|uniref:Delta n=1 Tax=New Kent County virus TaxID=2079603 RepID=A0A2K9YNI3_9RHAB|nr:delta [New Kent County virus]AUW34405.1 delta [New Kent County virus]